MKLIEKALKFAGKEKFYLDDLISIRYINRLCCKYGMMYLRGKLFALGWSDICSDIFIGKRVKVFEKKHLTTKKKVKIHEGVFIDALSSEGVHLGYGVVIGRDSRIECTGSIRSIGKGIKIGDNSTFGNDCFFGAAGGIKIGKDVVAGQFIRFHSENHDYSDSEVLIKNQGVSHKGIRIGDNCWIGSGVVFLDGAELEDGCVVAANAVVCNIIPQNSVVAGIPARVIKKR